ncbi:hypothetical protein TNCT_188911, partial [Trichonephila clavata]
MLELGGIVSRDSLELQASSTVMMWTQDITESSSMEMGLAWTKWLL